MQKLMNYGRPQELILPFKIPMGTRENFFENYRQFGYAPPKIFSRPGLRGLAMVQSPSRGRTVFLKIIVSGS